MSDPRIPSVGFDLPAWRSAGMITIEVPGSVAAREYGWHPYDEVQAHPLGWLPRDEAHELYRWHPHEPGRPAEMVASCPTFDAMAAANRLLSGAAYYPLWRARQPFAVGEAKLPGERDVAGPRARPR